MTFTTAKNEYNQLVITGIVDYNDETEITFPAHFNGQDIVGINRLRLLDSPNSSRLSKIKKITIPYTIQFIGDNAFTSLCFTDFVIPKDSQLDSIGRFAFADCQELKSIYIPSSVVYISVKAFNLCKSLESVIFEDNSNLKVIEYKAFAETGLKKVTLPSTLHNLDIDGESFANCPNLVDFDMSKSTITSIGENCCLDNRRLANISFPKTLEQIRSYAFRRIGPSNINLSDCTNLSEIGFGAFSESLITDVRLPYFSCATVSETAFNDAVDYNIGQCLLDNPFIEIQDNDIPF